MSMVIIIIRRKKSKQFWDKEPSRQIKSFERVQEGDEKLDGEDNEKPDEKFLRKLAGMGIHTQVSPTWTHTLQDRLLLLS